MHFLYLSIAIVAEVAATTALKASDSFTKLGPLAITAIGYSIAFYFLALTLKTIPVGIAYAIWSGLGIVLISTAGFVMFRQSLDVPALIGMALIIAGVIVINAFSKAVAHGSRPVARRARLPGCEPSDFLPENPCRPSGKAPGAWAKSRGARPTRRWRFGSGSISA